MSPYPVPHSREAAQRQAEMLVPQVILGWGADHPLAKEVALLAGKLKASNLAYEPPAPVEPEKVCAACTAATGNPDLACRVHGKAE